MAITTNNSISVNAAAPKAPLDLHIVAQVSNLPCRRFPIGRALGVRVSSGLEIRDTEDRMSALRARRRPPQSSGAPGTKRIRGVLSRFFPVGAVFDVPKICIANLTTTLIFCSAPMMCLLNSLTIKRPCLFKGYKILRLCVAGGEQEQGSGHHAPLPCSLSASPEHPCHRAGPH